MAENTKELEKWVRRLQLVADVVVGAMIGWEVTRQTVRDVVHLGPTALMGNTTEILKNANNSLEKSRKLLGNRASSLDRARATDMAVLASTAYKVVDARESTQEVERLLAATPALTGSHNVLGLLHGPDPETVLKALPEPDMLTEHRTLILGERPCGFVATADSDLIVVCRGSSDEFDWAINRRFLYASSLQIHQGYLMLGRWIWSQVLETIRANKPAGFRRVLFAGHSLGGVVARIASWHLTGLPEEVRVELAGTTILEEFTGMDVQTTDSFPSIKTITDVAVYTFGAPHFRLATAGERRNGAGIASRIHMEEYAFVNVGDPVAGFGALEFYQSSFYLLCGEGRLYAYDGSREARLLYMLELLTLVQRCIPSSSPTTIRLSLLKIQEAAMDASVNLDLNPFLHLWGDATGLAAFSAVREQHNIDRYVSQLVGGQSPS